MPEFKCDTCKSTDFEVKRRGPHYGLYCKKCGAWQKWLSKRERQSLVIEHDIQVNNSIYAEEDCPF